MSVNKSILFLSPSDISIDSRILKQIAVARNLGFEILALGIKEANRSSGNQDCAIKIVELQVLKLNKMRRFFRIISLIYFLQIPLVVLEIFFRLMPLALRFKPSIIHCSDYLFLPVAIVIKMITNSKLVYDAHELESKTNGISKLGSLYVFYLEKLSWIFINSAIFVSESIQTWYLTNIGPKKSEVILNSPIVKTSHEKNHYFRDCYNIPNNMKIFLYLGMLSRGRGINQALEIFKNLNDKAAIVFMGYGEMQDKITQYSIQYNNIFLHDPVNHDEVVQIASSADFGYCMLENVSLSDYYCLPNKLFEYIFAGLPIIASDFPEISRVVKELNLGLVTPLDNESITKGINFLSNNDSIYRLNRSDLTTLSWEFQAEKLRSLLLNLTKN